MLIQISKATQSPSTDDVESRATGRAASMYMVLFSYEISCMAALHNYLRPTPPPLSLSTSRRACATRAKCASGAMATWYRSMLHFPEDAASLESGVVFLIKLAKTLHSIVVMIELMGSSGGRSIIGAESTHDEISQNSCHQHRSLNHLETAIGSIGLIDLIESSLDEKIPVNRRSYLVEVSTAVKILRWVPLHPTLHKWSYKLHTPNFVGVGGDSTI